MIKKTFRDMAMATGLAAIVAGFGGCGPAPRAPPVGPGFMLFNLGRDFEDMENAMKARREAQNSQTQTPQPLRTDESIAFYTVYNNKGEIRIKGPDPFILNSSGTALPLGKGTCIIRYKNGDVYEGEYFDGKLHGKGKYTSADGSVREGIWEYGTYKGNSLSSRN